MTQGLAAGLGGVALVVFVCFRLVPVNSSTVGFLLLLVVLAVATARGFAPAAVVSVAATTCFNFFFLPPVGRLTIADPENWVALLTFLLTALVASHLSNRAREQAEQARASQQETEQLYALSRAILLTEAAQPVGPQAAQSIAQIFQLTAVAMLDGGTGQVFRGGAGELPDSVRDSMAEVAREGARRRELDVEIWPIALGGSPIGALAMAGMKASDGAVHSMLNLVAIALERVRMQEAANRAEAARQSEEFKSTLLDALAHEFKTPLTAIKAAATGLQWTSDRPAEQAELAAIIEEETDRLSQLVTEAVRMAEIDAGKVTPRQEAVAVEAIFAGAKAAFAGRGEDRIRVVEPASAGKVWADGALTELALRQLMDNALKYGPPVTPVVCRAERQDHRLVLSVTDEGAGVPERDRERIFHKFYRRPEVRAHLPGTGMGLHIAREIARMQGGDLWVEDARPRGAVFCLALPRGKSE